MLSKGCLKGKGLNTAVGDEGGFAPKSQSNEEALQVIMQRSAKRDTGGQRCFYRSGPGCQLLFQDGYYNLAAEGAKKKSAEMVDFYADYVDRYPIVTIEDGLAENDWDGWKLLTEKLGSRIQIVGDDIFVTNIELLQKGIERK